VEAGDVILLVNEGEEPHSFTGDDQEFDTGDCTGRGHHARAHRPDQITFSTSRIATTRARS
jgi:hypothetical protein